ncbi:MAG: hypothetical protein DRH57_09260 [Candidatus Cloacimonadota bacterium]|nr:MAG: hypothetical protein DRH57_09260 [Candidatus Cloacimonadota bacterium]
MILRQLIENTNIKYSNESADGPSSQYNGVIKATADKVVGTLEYTEFKGLVTISMIEVDKDFRGNKIGFNLIKELAKKYPYTKIIRGNLTDDGAKLYKSTEKYFAPYIAKGVDEWGKNLNFKKYFDGGLNSYSKKEISNILSSWNEEGIEIDDLDFFEDIEQIEKLLKQYKVKYIKTKNKIVIPVTTKLTDLLILLKNDFPKIEPKYLNDYGDFLETVYNKLQD